MGGTVSRMVQRLPQFQGQSPTGGTMYPGGSATFDESAGSQIFPMPGGQFAPPGPPPGGPTGPPPGGPQIERIYPPGGSGKPRQYTYGGLPYFPAPGEVPSQPNGGMLAHFLRNRGRGPRRRF